MGSQRYLIQALTNLPEILVHYKMIPWQNESGFSGGITYMLGFLSREFDLTFTETWRKRANFYPSVPPSKKGNRYKRSHKPQKIMNNKIPVKAPHSSDGNKSPRRTQEVLCLQHFTAAPTTHLFTYFFHP
ncbi:hypothetical protein TNCV_2495561 [Trichonephila clavipes]|nr:hypothetical protein TNCV_2495561 [Trichonephila clavipes]